MRNSTEFDVLDWQRRLDAMVQEVVDVDDSEVAIQCLYSWDHARKQIDRIQAIPPIARARERKRRQAMMGLTEQDRNRALMGFDEAYIEAQERIDTIVGFVKTKLEDFIRIKDPIGHIEAHDQSIFEVKDQAGRTLMEIKDKDPDLRYIGTYCESVDELVYEKRGFEIVCTVCGFRISRHHFGLDDPLLRIHAQAHNALVTRLREPGAI